MHVTRSRRQTPGITREGQMMNPVLRRSAHADQLEAEVRDACCCEEIARCAECRAKLAEVRAARRDALLHSIASVRPRRAPQ